MGPRFSGKAREEPQRCERKWGEPTKPRLLRFEETVAGLAITHSVSRPTQCQIIDCLIYPLTSHSSRNGLTAPRSFVTLRSVLRWPP